MIQVCAVIPAFDSQETIAGVVERTRPFVDRVVVVNDGSRDQTASAARRSGAHVIGSGRNRGKGRALKTAFAYALRSGFDAVVTLDADRQHNPDNIPDFLDAYRRNGADLIVGSRLHRKEAMPRARYVTNWVGIQCFSWLSGQLISDSQCGFRFYHRRLLTALPVLCDGFEAEGDMMLRAARKGFKIDFVPISVIYFNGNGHRSFYRPVRDTTDICMNFLRNMLWRNR